MNTYILGIESSCDDTSAAVLKGTQVLSNIIANQKVHEKYGGVVPELASRAHQQNIIPVIDAALKEAKIHKNEVSAVAFTRGPGLLGSLLVGTSFAKSFALSLGIPMLEIDHMDAHILAHFITDETEKKIPEFPFLCLTVSGGHTQIVLIKDYFDMEIIGKTIDDAAGETFDKAAKIMSLPYPGGPMIDKLAKSGNPKAFSFAEPRIAALDYSFSGLKTSILYFLRDRLKEDNQFIEKHKADLCASIQHTIVEILMKKLVLASQQTGIKHIAIAGGVSANSGLRNAMEAAAVANQWQIYIPKLSYSTDNAAMIAIAGYYKYQKKQFASQRLTPYARQSSKK
ncbi:MAG: tRNA (adenosine(37)-N6)-threonylcarbamoyltransferase complex transferase subunit TsaD [Bacteroidetes bacterium]|nr:tRNA (adenosine(37)-N6)-threonylcarbamoyltransferase complex transferase subunit TsaD [Bacteroidota bacterium]MBU1579749.1 tRNA (adenosine(37)-N6)-threonylcarbamoyltransferase complex transferase subunit TsaD [Bacteroidota bacterium]MBU2556371.1 tRNA (adenosine(37)-N6)-threonylcarbamoyltransferase complex transferase subunit TsaD [Bacteroidota bacterium]